MPSTRLGPASPNAPRHLSKGTHQRCRPPPTDRASPGRALSGVQPSSALTLGPLISAKILPRTATRIGFLQDVVRDPQCPAHLRLTGDCRATFVAANRRNRRLGQTTDLVYILYSHNSPSLRQGPMNWYRGYIKSSTCGSAWSWGSLCPPVPPGYGSNPDHWRTTDRTAKVPLRREHGAPGFCIGAPGRPTCPSPVTPLSQALLKPQVKGQTHDSATVSNSARSGRRG